MKIDSRRMRPLPAALIALAALGLGTAATAGAQEDAKAAQARPVTNTAQPPAASVSRAGDAASSNSTLAQSKFDLLDANHDGSVDKTEASASSVLAAQFEKFDGNHDGKLSLTEFAAINDLAAIKVDRKGYQ